MTPNLTILIIFVLFYMSSHYTGGVLYLGCHVCCGDSAQGLSHHLPPLLSGDDLEPEQDQPGHLWRGPVSPRPHPAQEEEVNRTYSITPVAFTILYCVE